MGILDASSETARMYIELGDLREKKRELMMEAGLKAFDLFKNGDIESNELHKMSDDITDMNNAIQIAAQEAKLEKKREITENLPQWRIFVDDLVFKLLNTAERMEAKQRYEALVIKGQEQLEDAGKVALTIRGYKDLDEINDKIRKSIQEIHQLSSAIEQRERKGEGGIGFLVSIISFGTSFISFFKKMKF